MKNKTVPASLLMLYVLAASLALCACGEVLQPAPVSTSAAVLQVTLPELQTPAPEVAEILYEVPEQLLRQRPHVVDVRTLPAASVERVVDGDTLVIVMDGRRDRLRLLGIDAPESSSNPDLSRQTKEGDVVSGIVSELLRGRTVFLEFDEEPRDQYGRLLAYVWLDEHTMLNENLVFSGLASVVRFPPNTAYYDYFRELNRSAREQSLGFSDSFRR